MKWRRLETRREKRERIQREREKEAANLEKQQAEKKRGSEIWSAYQKAWEHRLESPEAYAVFEREWRKQYGIHYSDKQEAELWIAYQRAKDGYVVDPELFVTYLERDPYEPFSGYAKQNFIRLLKRQELSRHHQDRLRQAILKVVDSWDRREFRHYCLLARKVDSPGLREELQARLASEDRGIRRRAGWMLQSLEHIRMRTQILSNAGKSNPL